MVKVKKDFYGNEIPPAKPVGSEQTKNDNQQMPDQRKLRSWGR